MVKEVIPKDDYILQLKLNTKEKILFDVKPYLNMGDFIILKDLKEFENFIAD